MGFRPPAAASGSETPLSKKQIDALIHNCGEFGITLYGLDDPRQGIVHIIGPSRDSPNRA